MARAFDPDAAAVGGGLFGLPFAPDEAEVVVIPVPWEATVSHGTGTADAPRAILEASRQLDLLDRETGRAYERGIAMLPIPDALRKQSDKARALAEPVIAAGHPGDDPELLAGAGAVNALCDAMNGWVAATARTWLGQEKLTALVGGDHSVPFGHIEAVAERYPGMGILHLDAHADLRDAFEGFVWSHASIMFNVMERISGVGRIVQVGIRDHAPAEAAMIENNPERIRTFFDTDLKHRLMNGEAWGKIIPEIISPLPENVYLSFDIDGLDPTLCPNTGTPVPGGLSFPEATALVRAVQESGRQIVGLDVNEVVPGTSGNTDWDANVGARLLYKMIGFALMTRQK